MHLKRKQSNTLEKKNKERRKRFMQLRGHVGTIATTTPTNNQIRIIVLFATVTKKQKKKFKKKNQIF